MDALKTLAEKPVDVVLLDLALPDISGWEVLAQLRQLPGKQELPVILITAHDWPQTSTDNLQESFKIMMKRPLSRRELNGTLKNILETVKPAYPMVSSG